MNNLRKLLYSAVLVTMTWYVSAFITRYGIYNWYAALEKPNFTPPDVVFPIVWGILYILMILSFFLVLRKSSPINQTRAHHFFLGQLFLQILWTFLFFQQGLLALAFLTIILLDMVVYKMIIYFKNIDKYSAYLLYPYFWWLIYASFLNFSFVYIHGMIVVF